MFRPFSLLMAFICLCLISAASAADLANSKPFNPDVSVNLLGLVRDGTGLSETRGASPYNGISLQEAEIQFFSNVDAYLKAVALFSISENAAGEYGIDPEEVYLETTTLPFVTLRAGKFKLALGKHNQLHTHAFPFIDAPLFQTGIIGDEGLNASAGSASFLFPTAWFSELTLQAYSLVNSDLYGDPVAGTAPPTGKTGVLGRFRNLWDLDENSTLEIGLSGSSGQNAFDLSTKAFGADLTLKWRPVNGGKYQAFIWNTEYLQAQRAGRLDANGDLDRRLGGIATYIQYQFAERWWIQTRTEILGIPRDIAPVRRKQSALLGFFPSEFSGFRFQYDRDDNPARPRIDHTFTFQYNVTIGAHPAHAY